MKDGTSPAALPLVGMVRAYQWLLSPLLGARDSPFSCLRSRRGLAPPRRLTSV